MKHFKTITSYCEAIQISPPKHPHFDIRSFEENMVSVVQKMPPFRHEFYAIALRANGDGKVISGHHAHFPDGATIFFNSPFQILSWDILPNWQGYYIMISQDFLSHSTYFQDLLDEFPFLKIDKTIPFTVEKKDEETLLKIYQNIQQEYHGKHQDKFQLIDSYVLLLLNYVKRYFSQQVGQEQANSQIREANLKLFTRFQTLIQTSFYPDAILEKNANLHSPSYYAEKLSIHPNHLNAVAKEISGQTASYQIQTHILQLAKAHLAQTQLSVKEIAYTLYFDSPNNFSAFFKKHTKITPLTYRKNPLL